MDILNILTSLFGQGTAQSIVTAIGLVYALIVAIANIVTMLSPSVSNSPTYNFIMKILNFLSLNILKNKNADDTSK